jgi:hypothetical protein
MKRLISVALCLIASHALAAADTFGVGDRHSGALDLSACTGTAFVNEYTTLTSITNGGSTLVVGDSSRFAAGDLVMVWQAAAMPAASVPSGAQAAFALAGSTASGSSRASQPPPAANSL